MKRQNLRAKAAKKYKATTNSNHNLPVAPNLLQQNFIAAVPNQKWVSDITYLWIAETNIEYPKKKATFLAKSDLIEIWRPLPDEYDNWEITINIRKIRQ